MTLDAVRALLDHLPDAPFFMKNTDLRYVCGNSAMLSLCGVSTESHFIGRTANDFFLNPKRYDEWDRHIMLSKQPLRDRIHLIKRPGSADPVWHLSGRWPVLDAHGAICGVAAIARVLKAPDRRNRKYERIASAIEHIQGSYRAPLDITELARRAGVSGCQLERDFVDLLGLPPRRYLQKVRLEAALIKLKGAETSIVDVALACGYTDQSAFTRSFRSATGITPSEYRRRQQTASRA